MLASLAITVSCAPWYSSPEWWLCILGVPTLFAILWQAKVTADTAKATQAIVEISSETAQRQLRAYLVVTVGDATFQERRDKNKGGDLMFECRPLLVNTGQTPAKKIRFKARAAVLPSPISKGLDLPETYDNDTGQGVLGPQQNAHMTAVVDGFQPDEQVADIKGGLSTKALYVWGLVSYEDVFGEKHFTRFCHHVYWDLKNNVRGHYMPDRNDSD